MLGDEGFHPVVYHQHRTVYRVEYGKIKHSAKEAMVFAELFRPGFELFSPLALVLCKVVCAIEQKLQLIVRISCVPEDTHQVDVEFVEVSEVGLAVILDLRCHFIHNTQWVASEEIFYFNKVSEVLEQ